MEPLLWYIRKEEGDSNLEFQTPSSKSQAPSRCQETSNKGKKHTRHQTLGVCGIVDPDLLSSKLNTPTPEVKIPARPLARYDPMTKNPWKRGDTAFIRRLKLAAQSLDR